MSLSRYRLPAIVVASPLWMACLQAQESLEEVVVTASRVARPLSTVPNTITVIDREALDQQLSVENDISTVLGNLIPSFSPSRQKFTNAGETLRGRKPLYMIDGVPQSNPLRNGGRDGHTIDPAVLERVEVLHGANAIHGLGASGGIINLITRRPTEELTQSLRLDTSVQAEDPAESAEYGLAYSFSNRFANDVDVLASVSLRDTGIFYDANGDVVGADNTQGDSMDSRTVNGFVKTGYGWDDRRIELMINSYRIEGHNRWISVPGDVAAGIPTSAVKGTLPGAGARNEVLTLSVNYNDSDVAGHSLSVQAFRQDFAATYGAESTPIATFQDPAYGPDLLDQSQNNSEKAGMKLTLARDDVAGLPLGLVYGLDLLRDDTWQALIQTGRTWVPQSSYDNVAAFAQLEYSGIDDLVVTTGVRHERSRLEVDDFTTLYSAGSTFVEGGNPDFDETLFNIGGTYQLGGGWRLYANYAEAFSMPDVGRVLRGINVPGQSVETFLDLKPILTENTELGVEYGSDRFTAQLSAYASDSDFGQRLQRGSDGIYTVRRELTEVDGFELRADWYPSEQDTLGLRYASTDGRYDSDADGRVDSDLDGNNVSPDRLNLSWEREWTRDVETRVQVNYLKDRDFTDSSGAVANSFDGYSTVDFTARVAAFGGAFNVAVQNVTNEDYVTYYSQNNRLDVRYFNGIGRSVTVAWQQDF